MKPVLFAAATAAALLAGAPAFTQSAPAPDRGTPPNTMAGADQYYRIDDPRRDVGQCFNGRNVVSASRGPGDILYLQPQAGAVFQMKLADSCSDLTAGDLSIATKLTVRSEGSNVCAGIPATVKIQTPSGARSCAVRNVRRLSGPEVASLAGR